MEEDLLDRFEAEREIEYQGEKYLVRDNGAVCRRGRIGLRKRPLDDRWTLGQPNASTGYMQISSHVVHRIVALAFHDQPTEDYVVDHIDTNRQNNRADNLRWVTRLENLLLNPITRNRIVAAYGSLEAFFEDPSSLGGRLPDFSWMRPVSKEEAAESRKRLMRWAEASSAPRGGKLGEWVYGNGSVDDDGAQELPDIQSDSPMALQRNWKTRGAFPSCPDSVEGDALSEYVGRLVPGALFFASRFGGGVVEVAGVSGPLIAVVSRMPDSAVKGWAVATVFVEDGRFVHESKGTYFSREGAFNTYNRLLHIEAPHVECIDDYC